jgi:hypothetical protein
MTWEQIRAKLPHQWLLIEAIEARTEGNRRVLEDIAVLRPFPSSESAMKGYGQLHHRVPQRELYVAHTDRVELEIEERRRLGIRGVA